MDIADWARKLHISSEEITDAIKNAGVLCETDLGGIYVSILNEVDTICLNQIKLHTNTFGTFPIVALPNMNLLLDYDYKLFSSTGLDIIVKNLIRRIPEIDSPWLVHRDLFSLVQFLTCIWTDILVEVCKIQLNHKWRPLVCFENPIYYQEGTLSKWDPACNILRAELYTILTFSFHFLKLSNRAYIGRIQTPSGKFRKRRQNKITDFPILHSDPETIYKYPGVACLETPATRLVACDILTKAREQLARFCYMTLRMSPDSIPINKTTWETLPEDLLQIFTLIQKMENFINS